MRVEIELSDEEVAILRAPADYSGDEGRRLFDQAYELAYILIDRVAAAVPGSPLYVSDPRRAV